MTEHPDERIAANPRDSVSGPLGPVGDGCARDQADGMRREPQVRDEAAGALKSSRIGTKSWLDSGLLAPLLHWWGHRKPASSPYAPGVVWSRRWKSWNAETLSSSDLSRGKGFVRVFISSVITGYERYRDAVAAAVESLGHAVVRAEDFGALPGTPQQACLDGV